MRELDPNTLKAALLSLRSTHGGTGSGKSYRAGFDPSLMPQNFFAVDTLRPTSATLAA
jgi:hypothetical protein